MSRKEFLTFHKVGIIKTVMGYIYAYDEKYKVIKLLDTKDPFSDDPWHCYPVSYHNCHFELTNMDPELNKYPGLFTSDEAIKNTVFYFVTHTNMESTFGMDIDGDALIMHLKKSDYDSPDLMAVIDKGMKRLFPEKKEG